MDDGMLPAFALRLALTGHVDIPREGEIDPLIEAEKLFAPAQPKADKKPSAKAMQKPANAKAKTTKKKAGKKVAA